MSPIMSKGSRGSNMDFGGDGAFWMAKKSESAATTNTIAKIIQIFTYLFIASSLLFLPFLFFPQFVQNLLKYTVIFLQFCRQKIGGAIPVSRGGDQPVLLQDS